MDKLIVVVGDIHGCLEEFDELLKKIEYKPEQMRLVLLGDLMDRGPDPVGCVRRARELGVECVMGNHEEKHLRWHRHQKKQAQTGKANPMRPLAEVDQKANAELSDQDFTWLKSLPLKLQLTEQWWAVHGGCEPRHSLQDQDPKQIIRCRYVTESGVAVSLNPDKSQPEGTKYWAELWHGRESIIYGHCVHSLETPRLDYSPFHGACLGIDTGCCFGGHLTAAMMKLPKDLHVVGERDIEFVQVKAKKKYFEGYGDE